MEENFLKRLRKVEIFSSAFNFFLNFLDKISQKYEDIKERGFQMRFEAEKAKILLPEYCFNSNCEYDEIIRCSFEIMINKIKNFIKEDERDCKKIKEQLIFFEKKWRNNI